MKRSMLMIICIISFITVQLRAATPIQTLTEVRTNLQTAQDKMKQTANTLQKAYNETLQTVVRINSATTDLDTQMGAIQGMRNDLNLYLALYPGYILLLTILAVAAPPLAVITVPIGIALTGAEVILADVPEGILPELLDTLRVMRNSLDTTSSKMLTANSPLKPPLEPLMYKNIGIAFDAATQKLSPEQTEAARAYVTQEVQKKGITKDLGLLWYIVNDDQNPDPRGVYAKLKAAEAKYGEAIGIIDKVINTLKQAAQEF